MTHYHWQINVSATSERTRTPRGDTPGAIYPSILPWDEYGQVAKVADEHDEWMSGGGCRSRYFVWQLPKGACCLVRNADRKRDEDSRPIKVLTNYRIKRHSSRREPKGASFLPIRRL
jgi:hypothetical protein